MIPAKTISDIEKKIHEKYGDKQKRLIGIMLARYSSTMNQKIVDENYRYWDYNTEDDFNVYWPGYGAYNPDEANGDIVINIMYNKEPVFYNEKAFVTAKKALKPSTKKKYSDSAQFFILQYSNGKLRYDEAIVVEFSKIYDPELINIRKFMEWLTDMINECDDLKKLNSKINKHETVEFIKKSFSIENVSDVIGLIGNAVGAFATLV